MISPYFTAKGISLYLGDAREVLPSLAWDVCLTDPPYSEQVHGVGRIQRRKGKQIDRAEFEYTSATDELRERVSAELGRTPRWVGVFSDIESCHLWRQTLRAASLEYVRTCAWVKESPLPQLTGDRPAVGLEPLTLCHAQSPKRWNGGGSAGVWREGSAANDTATRIGGQKPERLMRRLVQLFSDENETILDCFAGSGTTLVAALQLNRKAIGVEVREPACEIIAKRIEAELRQGNLFDTPDQEVA